LTLDDIVKNVLKRLSERKKSFSLKELKARAKRFGPARDFLSAIRRGEGQRVRVIAEVKKASPSRGIIRHDFDPVKIALDYARSGASAISVLTEEDSFLGHPGFLEPVRSAVDLPLLRKDFILEPYQVVEARALGADAFLLIVSLLTDEILRELISLGAEFGMEALVEVHSEEELERAMNTSARVIGINNRDLKTFVTDMETTFRLMRRGSQGRVIVSESGIKSAGDLRKLELAGVDAVLIGETLMRSSEPGEKLQELLRY
jgi:indole-3-glycerol phosphate synthase